MSNVVEFLEALSVQARGLSEAEYAQAVDASGLDATIRQALLARDIVIDYRPNAGIRVAPHFYTTDDEVDAAVAAMDEILATGEWRKYGERASVVT